MPYTFTDYVALYGAGVATLSLIVAAVALAWNIKNHSSRASETIFPGKDHRPRGRRNQRIWEARDYDLSALHVAECRGLSYY